MQAEFSLGELAVRFGLELRGDPQVRVSHVATLAQATRIDGVTPAALLLLLAHIKTAPRRKSA